MYGILETPIPVEYMDSTVSLFRRLLQEDEMIPRQRDRLDASSEPKAVWWTFFLGGALYTLETGARKRYRFVGLDIWNTAS